MSEQEMVVLLDQCMICDLEGKAEKIQKIQGGGTLYRMAHLNGKVHSWTEYKSMQSITDSLERKKQDGPKMINCPICNKRGRLNEYHPRDEIRHQKEKYVVVHEKIKGTWGKSKVAKRRRCYIKKQKDIETVLKKLGRYIEPSKTMNGFIPK